MKENLKYMFTYKYNIVTMTKVFEPEKRHLHNFVKK